MNSEDVAIGDLQEPPGKLVSGFRWSRFKDASSSEDSSLEPCYYHSISDESDHIPDGFRTRFRFFLGFFAAVDA
jgi:hypothetical protein